MLPGPSDSSLRIAAPVLIEELAAEFGRPVPLRLVVDETPNTPPPEVVEEVPIDVEELRDATPAAVASPIDHVMQAHQGADLDFLVGKSGAKVAREAH